MRRRYLVHVAFLSLFGAAPLAAQAPDTSMPAFYASLTGLSPAELQARHAHPADQVRLGFVLLELYRRNRDPALASQTARVFATVVKSNPDNAWAHLGLGLTLRRARKTMAIVRNVGAADGEAALVSKREIQKAFDLAPEFSESNELMLAAFGQSPEKLRADSIAAILAGAPRTAIDFLQLARAHFGQHDDRNAEAVYWKGTAVWDSAAASAYAYDVAVIATPQEMVSLTDGTLAKRATALHQFWKKRAVRGGISIGERMGVHYRRIETARLRYAMPKGSCKIGTNIFGARRKGIESEVDDRGLVLIRFGTPSKAVTPPFGYNVNCVGTELWSYHNPDGSSRVFYFAKGHIEPDALRAFSNADGDAEMAEFLSGLSGFDARYAFIAARALTIHTFEFMKRVQTPSEQMFTDSLIERRREDARRQNDRITYENRAEAFAAFGTDAATPAFKRTLAFFHDVATFRGRGCTDVVYSMAAAAPSYRVNVEIVDTFTWEGHSVDAVVSKEAPEGAYVRSTGVFCAAPDHNAYARFTVQADSLTGATAGGELSVPDYSGPALMMSDLLFAAREPGPFVRGNAHLAIVPPRQFRANEGFRVFYELYNLPRGRPYKTEITFTTVRPSFFARLLGRKDKTTVTFNDVAQTDDVVQELRTLIPEIAPGKVSVTIKVTDLTTSESATSSETIWVLLPANNEAH